MRTGYVIRDRSRRGYFAGRQRPTSDSQPVTVYVQDPDHALQWRNLKDAKRFLRLLRSESRNPGGIRIIDPKWRVVC